jgi:ATP-dependent Lhr-like helicase
MPNILITTPESLAVMLSYPDGAKRFGNLHAVIVDEWHELLGSKRGVQTELGLAHLHRLRGEAIQVWGVSATIGNLEQARAVLVGPKRLAASVVVKSTLKKEYKLTTLIPSTIDNFPWGGHMGLNMIEKVIPLIEASRSCLVFTNTRSQAEIWYRGLLEAMPELAGNSALHHGSLEKEIRGWVEDALRDGKNVLLEIEIAGAKQVKESAPEAILVFLQPDFGSAMIIFFIWLGIILV